MLKNVRIIDVYKKNNSTYWKFLKIQEALFRGEMITQIALKLEVKQSYVYDVYDYFEMDKFSSKPSFKNCYFVDEIAIKRSLNLSYSVKELKGDELIILNNLLHHWKPKDKILKYKNLKYD
jgi:hypothetical protein